MTNPEFEIALFRAVIKARPVGLNRHFHFLSVQQSMTTELGHDVQLSDIKRKLASLYDLDGLDNQVDTPTFFTRLLTPSRTWLRTTSYLPSSSSNYRMTATSSSFASREHSDHPRTARRLPLLLLFLPQKTQTQV